MIRSLALLTSLAVSAGPVFAEGPVVVELFTSQGCSSCPPADEILHGLAERDDVIPLALHVDYWDYIGWVDEFADPEHTVRQQNYVRVAGGNSIYTPQMIIGGQDHLIGARAMAEEISATVSDHRARPTGVQVSLERNGDQLAISGTTEQPIANNASVQVVRFSPLKTVDIRRGENAGRELSYANVVTEWTTVGEWSGNDDLQLDVSVAGDDPFVVIIQEQGPGAVLATAVLR